MPRNSGTYSAPAGQPVANGDIIDATVHNNLITDIGNEITNSIPRDGTAPPTANIPMGNYKHTGLAAGTANGDSVRYEQAALLAGATFTGYINEARGTVTMHATTMDLWAQPNTIDGTGSAVTITAIANAPQAGAKRTLYPIAGTVITNGATFVVDGAANYTTAAGDALEFEAVTTSTYKVHITKKDGTAVAGGTQTSKIQSVGYSLAANALTLTLEPTSLDFRSTTLTTGTPTTISNAAQIATTISSGSTGGTVSAVQSKIYILAINNAGTMELAWCNASGGINLDETTLISTTAEGGAGAADSATVIYSTTARSNVAFRVVGVFRSTQTTAGTWAQTPSLVQGYGGQSLITAAMQKSCVRLNTANGYGSTNTAIRRFTNVATNQGTDITYADSATLGATFTINTSGAYVVSYTDTLNTAATLGISLNSTQLTTSISLITAADRLASITTAGNTFQATIATGIQLNAGDVIRAHTDTAANNGIAQFTITRVA